MDAFNKALIHDLDEDGFADMYAQTIAYGLLSARISRPEGLVADNMAEMVPVTNPFLKEMLESFLRLGGRRRTGLGWTGIDFDELGINEIVQLLREANMEAVLRDFGDRNPHEDPVIHFYEHFLKEYDAKKRMQRGVFYTPRPVVSYIVRSVHELLQTEFGLADGLADTATWVEMLEKHPHLKLPPLSDSPGEIQTIPPDEPFVQILDPATGTATFLVEVIEVIHRTLHAKWKGQRLNEAQQISAWNDYVPRHLLPRLHGYELMMAPYAIAHMKIGLKLAETGYHFGGEGRARIFLTNALEPWVRQLPLIGFEALAHEAEAVNEIKRSKRFIVVIGNPPYSNYGQLNKNPFILGLLDDYKRGLDEKKLNLDDDFIKFVRLAHWQEQIAKCGVVGVITNHVYLAGTTHRRLREVIFSDFSLRYLADLHGNSRIGETCPDGSVDENIFDIQQGVAISLLVSACENAPINKTYHVDITGTRSKKYEWASRHSVTSSKWQALTPRAPDFMFIPSKNLSGSSYESGLPVPEILNLACSGIETQRDNFVMHFKSDDVWSLVNKLSQMSVDAARKEFELGPDGRDWKLKLAIDDIKASGPVINAIVPIAYRPFDVRWTYYTGNTKGFLAYPRLATARHMFGAHNIAMVMKRSRLLKADQFSHVFVIRHAMDKNFLGDQSYFLPLYSKSETRTLFSHRESNQQELQANVSAEALALVPIGTRIGVGTQPQVLASNIFNYVYSVLNSPGYRSRFLDYLRQDYPRIPFTSNSILFQRLSFVGGELVALHLLESPTLDQPMTELIGSRNPEVEHATWSNDTVWLDKRQTNGFKGVPECVWNFHVGGHQVCQKWLKYRKGRTLSDEDIAHYHKIVVALNESIRLMKEIDAVIDQHGGWPEAFAMDTGEQA